MTRLDDIKHQEELLVINRRNLTHYLNQLGQQGPLNQAVGTKNGIVECRTNIRRIKANLAEWSVRVQDNPDDFDTAKPVQSVQVNMGVEKVMLVMSVEQFTALLQHNSELLQYLVYKS